MDSGCDLSISALSKKNSAISHNVKRKEVGGDKVVVSPFVTKTYNMIDECDASIATWSKGGLSFVVKDVDSFASKILCRYFKHKNFSSFVRQLNLHGFRKIKSINNNDNIDELQFRHEHFQRGRFDLLSKIIRKSSKSQSSPDNKSHAEKLKVELHELRKTLSTVTTQFGELSSLVNNLMMMKNKLQHVALSTSTTSPKRKQGAIIDAPDSPSSSMTEFNTTMVPSISKKPRLVPPAITESTTYSLPDDSSTCGSSSCTSTSLSEESIHPLPLHHDDKFEFCQVDDNHSVFGEEGKSTKIMDFVDFTSSWIEDDFLDLLLQEEII